jgi:hypothetical protein
MKDAVIQLKSYFTMKKKIPSAIKKLKLNKFIPLQIKITKKLYSSCRFKISLFTKR